MNSGFVFVMFSFKPCQTISILPLSTIRTFKCESHVQIVSSGICSRHKFLSLQHVIPGQSQSCGRWHKSQASMSSWEKRVGWQSDDIFPAPGDVMRCPFCGVTPRIIHGWHFCIETGDPEIRRFEKPPLRWGMAGDLLTRALEGLPCVNTFGWSDDPSNYLGKLQYFTNLNSSAILGWFPLLTIITRARENSEVVTKNEVLRINIPVVVSPCQCLDHVS